MSVTFHSEEVKFRLRDIRAVRYWLQETVEVEGCSVGELTFVFCTDDYLHNINKSYLNHDTLTDIITFDYTENKTVAGDVFISIERTRENAKTFGVSHKDELHRIIIHGVLHLLGYKDKKPTEKALMTRKEDFYLSLRKF